jgi:hypothetical protein
MNKMKSFVYRCPLCMGKIIPALVEEYRGEDWMQCPHCNRFIKISLYETYEIY